MKPFVLTICLLLFTPSLTFASSGRTNSQGCHNSKKEGYHCHGSSGGNHQNKASSSSEKVQVPVVTSKVSAQEYMLKATSDNTTAYHFEICAQSLRERSQVEPAELLENSEERYSAHFTPLNAPEQIVICHRNNKRTLIYP